MIKLYDGPTWKKGSMIPAEFTAYVRECLRIDPAFPYLHLDQLNDLPYGTCCRQARLMGFRRLDIRTVPDALKTGTPEIEPQAFWDSEKGSSAAVTGSGLDLKARAAELVLERLRESEASDATAWITALAQLTEEIEDRI